MYIYENTHTQTYMCVCVCIVLVTSTVRVTQSQTFLDFIFQCRYHLEQKSFGKSVKAALLTKTF